MDKEELRRRKIQEWEAEMEALQKRIPALSLLEEEIRKKTMERIRQAFSPSSGPENQRLEKEVYSLLKEKEALLRSHGISMEALEPDWECRKCSDRGYLSPGVPCECAGKVLQNQLLQKSGLTGEMREKTFDNFDTSYYLDPEAMQKKVARSLEFVHLLNQKKKQHNLYFFGGVGTGKTHLSLAIANQALQYRNSVIYKRIDDLVDIIISLKYEEKGKKDQLEILKTVDLLIIDDLGAEKTTDFVRNQLRIILEERKNLNKPIIINSNYSITDLQDSYGDRVVDRIIENFEIHEFKTRESIRLIKKREGMRE